MNKFQLMQNSFTQHLPLWRQTAVSLKFLSHSFPVGFCYQYETTVEDNARSSQLPH